MCSGTAAILINATDAGLSAAVLTDTPGQLPPRRPYFLITVVDALSLCIGTKVATTVGQSRQSLTQLVAFLFTLHLPGTGSLVGRLPLLPTCVEEALGTRLALAGRVITFDDLRSDLDLLGAGPWPRIEVHVALGIDPAVDPGHRRRRGQHDCNQYRCDAHGVLPIGPPGPGSLQGLTAWVTTRSSG